MQGGPEGAGAALRMIVTSLPLDDLTGSPGLVVTFPSKDFGSRSDHDVLRSYFLSWSSRWRRLGKIFWDLEMWG
jgi:hypothetical protein